MPFAQLLVDDVDDWEDELGSVKPASNTQIPSVALRQRLLSSRYASSSQGAERHQTGAHALQAYCLGCLGQYIEELLLCGGEVLPHMPPDAKACLMAIARRQNLLDDSALEMLRDSSWTSVDVSHSRVSDAALQKMLQTTPHLISLDVTGRKLSQQTIQSLGRWCPQLQVLRLGSISAQDERVWSVNMKHIMPNVAQLDSAADTWEALSAPAAAPDQASCSKAPAQHRLSQLLYLIWPSIPSKTADRLATSFPKVSVNPQSGFCPCEANQRVSLDEQWMQMVAPFWQQEEAQEPEEPEHVTPLCERFRMAYISRAERIAAKSERNYQQRKRRELRNNTVLQALARFKYL